MRTPGTRAKVISARWRTARTVLLSISLSVTCLSSAEQKPKPPAAVRPAKSPQQKTARQQASRAKAQESNQAARSAAQALNAPMVMKLAQMSPEERAAALAKLPPERRQQLEERLDNFAKRLPEQQARDLSQAKRLEALPPDRRIQVRESLRELQETPPPRRSVIGVELNKLGSMTDEQRDNYMSKPAFIRRFSPSEIEMMNNLHGIVP